MLLMLMKSAFKCNRTFCRKLMTMRKEETMFRKTISNNKLVLKRSLFVTSSKACNENDLEVKELQIPVPYGHIAAKAWGKETGTPVLALHGWLDNAGTFDKLIPLLLPSLYTVAIDIPGHGLSSHKLPGSFYTSMDSLIDYKRVVDYLQWTKFNIIGHSMGGAHAQLYASLFPESVDKIVVLDLVKHISGRPDQLAKKTREEIELNLKAEKKLLNQPPVYSMEAAVQRLKEGSANEITDDTARILLKRGTRLSDCGKGFIYSRDLRARTIELFQGPTDNALRGYMSTLKCEMLLVLSSNTDPIFSSQDSPEVLAEYIEIYTKNCKKFVLKEVNGNHFVHLDYPELIAPLINSFLC